MARAPAGRKKKMGLDRQVLSSLTGLVLYLRHNPAMNRWAIFERPSGTWTHDTLNRYPLGGERAGSGPFVCRSQHVSKLMRNHISRGIERGRSATRQSEGLPDRSVRMAPQPA